MSLVDNTMRALAAMEAARCEVAERAMAYWRLIDAGYRHTDHSQRLHAELMVACETYDAAREMVIEP